MVNEYNYFIWYLHIILESLPISSSSHIKLINNYFGKEDFSEDIEHLMHIPTVLIISFFIFQNYINLNFIYLFLYAFIADLITGIFYYFFKSIDKNKFSITIGLIITALLLCSLYFKKYFLLNNYEEIDLFKAVLLGIVQGISLLPGISRLASTYVIGSWLSLSPKDAFIFSLIIQLPLIIAAIVKSIYKLKINKFKFFQITPKKLFLLILSSIISYFLLYLMFVLAINNMLWLFGIYMLLPISFSFFEKKIT